MEFIKYVFYVYFFSCIEQLLKLQHLVTLSVCMSHPRCHTLNVDINHTKCRHYSHSAFSDHQPLVTESTINVDINYTKMSTLITVSIL